VLTSLCVFMSKLDNKTISIKRDTQRALWKLKEKPDDTYDEIIRELLNDARDIEVRPDE